MNINPDEATDAANAATATSNGEGLSCSHENAGLEHMLAAGICNRAGLARRAWDHHDRAWQHLAIAERLRKNTTADRAVQAPGGRTETFATGVGTR
jgi:hypothetical protein